MSRKFIILVVLLALGCSFAGGCLASTQQINETTTPRVTVDVDDVAADPSAYDGIIGIRGIVSFVYPSDSTFVIIDVKEYELCEVVTCAINEIAITVPQPTRIYWDNTSLWTVGGLVRSSLMVFTSTCMAILEAL